MQRCMHTQGQRVHSFLYPTTRRFARYFNTSCPLHRSSKSSKRAKPKPSLSLQQPKILSQTGFKFRREIVDSQRFCPLIRSHLDAFRQEIRAVRGSLENWDEFADIVISSSLAIRKANDNPNNTLSLGSRLVKTYLENGASGLTRTLKMEYRNHIYDKKFSGSRKIQQKIADFRHPTEWFPAARAVQRHIHLHVGPTNSGKTYHALKRLEEAKTGFYAGPLRLLAHEVYTRFNAKGIPCGLITGDEVRLSENYMPRIFSNTVEMVPLGQEVEVGVIDEIQMIGDPERGWAWTRALLGSRAQELHLCGEERTVQLIQEIVASTGDRLTINRYKRLNPLKPMKTSLGGNLTNLQKGDCVVAFSRITIHALKQEIERATGRRAAIVYGSLPAEIRAQQADLFNDPNNDYDFLVASDAIGMGLNLSCKRIIFESVVRRLPSGLSRLSVSQIKQIGGRAGRYRTASGINGSDDASNIGWVTSLEDVDLPYIREALTSDAPNIPAAGLLPLDHTTRNFADHFPSDIPFAYVLQRMASMASTSPNYFLCDMKSHVAIAEMLQEIPSLGVADRLLFAAAPIASNGMATITKAFGSCVAHHLGGQLLDIPELNLDVLDKPVSGDKDYLRSLEELHRALVLYLWLSYRSGGVFTERTLATHVKEIVEGKMDRALSEFSANRRLRRASSLQRQVALSKEIQKQNKLAEDRNNDIFSKSVVDASMNAVPTTQGSLFSSHSAEMTGNSA